MKIYLAHPISGLSYDEVMDYYKDTTMKMMMAGYKVLCPMTGKDALRNEVSFKAEGYGTPISTNRAILGRDHWMINQADVVYINLTGSKSISIGCCMELAFAYTHHKHVILVMEKDNIHKHCFVLESADIIYETTEEAEAYLNRLAKGIDLT
jgi:nucleoside 2-deoxyribosyltransferase